MGHDLELTASREITVNKTGKVETQSYSISVINFTREECEAIVNSNDPYKEYCNTCRKYYTSLDPIYIWDNLEDMSEFTCERYRRSMVFAPEKQDIVRYVTQADNIINELNTSIKQALDNSYKLTWWISY